MLMTLLRVIAIAALHIHYIARELHSTDQSLDVIPTICRQTEIFYAIMASTIPCLRPFLASFFTGFGAMGGETIIAGSQVGNSHEKGSKGSYAMGSMQSTESAAQRLRSLDRQVDDAHAAHHRGARRVDRQRCEAEPALEP